MSKRDAMPRDDQNKDAPCQNQLQKSHQSSGHYQPPLGLNASIKPDVSV